MKITFACPRCDRPNQLEFLPQQRELNCRHCGASIAVPEGAVVVNAQGEAEVARCLACPSHELYVRKDFPQRLGVAIVVLGFALSCVTWYLYWTYTTFAVLFATALADLLLFTLVGEALVCYRCGAQYRPTAGIERHGGFELATHERYRQQAARLARQQAGSRPRSPGR